MSYVSVIADLSARLLAWKGRTCPRDNERTHELVTDELVEDVLKQVLVVLPLGKEMK